MSNTEPIIYINTPIHMRSIDTFESIPPVALVEQNEMGQI